MLSTAEEPRNWLLIALALRSSMEHALLMLEMLEPVPSCFHVVLARQPIEDDLHARLTQHLGG